MALYWEPIVLMIAICVAVFCFIREEIVPRLHEEPDIDTSAMNTEPLYDITVKFRDVPLDELHEFERVSEILEIKPAENETGIY